MKIVRQLSAIVLLFFGLVTLFMSTSVIYDLFGIRAKEGNYVPFIVWSNHICGFLYVFSAYGLFSSKPWTTRILLIASTILLLSFAGLIWHVNTGGVYEQRTVFAMLFRIGVTILFAALSWRFVRGANR
ncbi:MAG: hypothetical protein JST46_11730 [Bacteroidetes bacterium]|nr:hypothetical protein [Bacteroidota bacterium]